MARAEVRAVWSVSPGSPRASSRMAVITGRMSRKLDTMVRKRDNQRVGRRGGGCAAAARRCADEQPSGCGS
eukprot:6637827-Prymnesium_polylepis.1